MKDGMKLLLALETPAGGGPSAAASAFASVVSAVGRHKLGLDGDGKAACHGPAHWESFWISVSVARVPLLRKSPRKSKVCFC